MKLEIIKGKDWTADFTVVSDNGLTAQVLDLSDTATISIATTGNNPSVVISNVSMTIQDKDNGRFTVTVPAAQTSLLSSSIGFKEDKYPTVANYVGILDFNLVSGDRTATVDLFVRDIGL